MSAEPTEDCKHEAGLFAPRIDRSRCEGKEDCARVCPYGVFEVRRLTGSERRELSTLSRLKVFAHGGKQAFAALADECRACGLCVQACPERDIKLQALGP